MERLEYDVVDVFTDTAFAGNPLAVVQGADGLETRQLQAIAREFHLSETAFPLDAGVDEVAGGATYALRIFTPEAELPFAGHPSIGTAWLLAQQAPDRARGHRPGLRCGPAPARRCLPTVARSS